MSNPLAEAFRLYRRNFGLIVAVVVTVMPAKWVFDYVFIYRGSEKTMWSTPVLAGYLLSIVLVSLSTTAIIHALAESRKGRQAGYLNAMEKGLRNWPRLFLVTLVTSLLVFLGFVLLVIPGFIIAMRYFLALPAAVLEGARVPQALKRSAVLTHGKRWELFVYSFVLGLIVFPPFELALWALHSFDSTGGLVAQALIRGVMDIAVVMATALAVVFYFRQLDVENHAGTLDGGKVGPTPSAGPSSV